MSFSRNFWPSKPATVWNSLFLFQKGRRVQSDNPNCPVMLLGPNRFRSDRDQAYRIVLKGSETERETPSPRLLSYKKLEILYWHLQMGVFTAVTIYKNLVLLKRPVCGSVFLVSILQSRWHKSHVVLDASCPVFNIAQFLKMRENRIIPIRKRRRSQIKKKFKWKQPKPAIFSGRQTDHLL